MFISVYGVTKMLKQNLSKVKILKSKYFSLFTYNRTPLVSYY